MIIRRLSIEALVLLSAICLGSCGNYSNDDLDIQLALPQQSDIEAKMQVSVSRTD